MGQMAKQCQYCWHPTLHNKGCPVLTEEKTAMEQWQQGWWHGLNGEYIHWRDYTHYPLSFVYGYRCGRNELENQISHIVAQRNS